MNGTRKDIKDTTKKYRHIIFIFFTLTPTNVINKFLQVTGKNHWERTTEKNTLLILKTGVSVVRITTLHETEYFIFILYSLSLCMLRVVFGTLNSTRRQLKKKGGGTLSVRDLSSTKNSDLSFFYTSSKLDWTASVLCPFFQQNATVFGDSIPRQTMVPYCVRFD